MINKVRVLYAATALSAAGLAVPVQAASINSAAASKPSAGATYNLQDVAYRRCWWRDGHRYCRWIGDDYGYYDNYDYGYAYPGIAFGFGGFGGRGHFGGNGHGHGRR